MPNFLDMMIAMTLVVMMTLASATMNQSSESAASNAARTFVGILGQGASLNSLNGFTVAGVQSSEGGRPETELVLYKGRPEAGTSAGVIVRAAFAQALITIGGQSTFGIFVSSNGRVSVVPGWTAWQTYSADPGGCTDTLSVTVAGVAFPVTLSCSNAAVATQ